MAIKPIEEMIRSVSRRGETQVASEMGPYDFSGWYDMYTDMQSRGELPDWMDSFDEGPNSFMQNLDVLDISPWDFVQRKGKKGTQMAMSDAPEDYLKRAVEQFIIDFPEFEDLPSEELYKEMEKKGYFSDRYAMSDPHPDAERADMMDIMSEKYFGKPYDKLTPKEIELLEENWDELISQTKQPRDIRQVNQGGIIGLRLGGDLKTELEQIHNPAENGQQGIMQLAGGFSGDDVIQSAIIWAAGLEQFGSIDAVIKSLQDGTTDVGGLVNAYMDARGDMN